MSSSPTSTRSSDWPVDSQSHLEEGSPCGFGVRVGLGATPTSDLKGEEKQQARSPNELEMETTMAVDPARGRKGKERETAQSGDDGFREQYDVIAMAGAPGKKFQYWRDRRPLSQELCALFNSFISYFVCLGPSGLEILRSILNEERLPGYSCPIPNFGDPQFGVCNWMWRSISYCFWGISIPAAIVLNTDGFHAAVLALKFFAFVRLGYSSLMVTEDYLHNLLRGGWNAALSKPPDFSNVIGTLGPDGPSMIYEGAKPAESLPGSLSSTSSAFRGLYGSSEFDAQTYDSPVSPNGEACWPKPNYSRPPGYSGLGSIKLPKKLNKPISRDDPRFGGLSGEILPESLPRTPHPAGGSERPLERSKSSWDHSLNPGRQRSRSMPPQRSHIKDCRPPPGPRSAIPEDMVQTLRRVLSGHGRGGSDIAGRLGHVEGQNIWNDESSRAGAQQHTNARNLAGSSARDLPDHHSRPANLPGRSRGIFSGRVGTLRGGPNGNFVISTGGLESLNNSSYGSFYTIKTASGPLEAQYGLLKFRMESNGQSACVLHDSEAGFRPGERLENVRRQAGAYIEPDKCAICYEDWIWRKPSRIAVRRGDDLAWVLSRLPCGHCFHGVCLAVWFSQGRCNCPYCRTIYQSWGNPWVNCLVRDGNEMGELPEYSGTFPFGGRRDLGAMSAASGRLQNSSLYSLSGTYLSEESSIPASSDGAPFGWSTVSEGTQRTVLRRRKRLFPHQMGEDGIYSISRSHPELLSDPSQPPPVHGGAAIDGTTLDMDCAETEYWERYQNEIGEEGEGGSQTLGWPVLGIVDGCRETAAQSPWPHFEAYPELRDARSHLPARRKPTAYRSSSPPMSDYSENTIEGAVPRLRTLLLASRLLESVSSRIPTGSTKFLDLAKFALSELIRAQDSAHSHASAERVTSSAEDGYGDSGCKGGDLISGFSDSSNMRSSPISSQCLSIPTTGRASAASHTPEAPTPKSFEHKVQPETPEAQIHPPYEPGPCFSDTSSPFSATARGFENEDTNKTADWSSLPKCRGMRPRSGVSAMAITEVSSTSFTAARRAGAGARPPTGPLSSTDKRCQKSKKGSKIPILSTRVKRSPPSATRGRDLGMFTPGLIHAENSPMNSHSQRCTPFARGHLSGRKNLGAPQSSSSPIDRKRLNFRLDS